MKLSSLIPAGRIPALLALLLATTVVFGAGDDPIRVERLGHQLICVCGCNQILLECNHLGCTYSTRMRSELMRAVGGNNDAAVYKWFVDQYGATVLAAPPNAGFNRLAWVMPYVALLVGIGTIIFVVRAWRARPPRRAPGAFPSRESGEVEAFREQVRREAGL